MLVGGAGRPASGDAEKAAGERRWQQTREHWSPPRHWFRYWPVNDGDDPGFGKEGSTCLEGSAACNAMRRIMLPGQHCNGRSHGPAEPEVGWPSKDKHTTRIWCFGAGEPGACVARTQGPAPAPYPPIDLGERCRGDRAHRASRRHASWRARDSDHSRSPDQAASVAGDSSARGGWRETIIEQHSAIERVIEDLPSLRQAVGRVIAREIGFPRRQASVILPGHGQAPRVDVELLSYSGRT